MSSGSRRALLVVLALLAVAGIVATGTAFATGPSTQAAQVEPMDPGNQTTVIKVTLQSDSDARWTVTEHFNTSTAADRAAFEELADRFERGQSAQLGLSSFRQALGQVEPTVEREMQIQEVRRDSSVDAGTLEVSFTWTNFAREVNETRIVDDAFTTPGGTWFNGLGPGESLVIELPRGSAIDTPKRVSSGTIRWDGPTEFQPGYLEISYTSNSLPAIPPLLWGLVVGLAVFAVVGVVGGYLLTRRDGEFSVPSLPIGTKSDGESTDAPAPDPGTTDETSTESAASADDGVDLSLLSDEERVEYLIEENGGRMKQANIVKETGWSNAKVSQLLSAMEEEGRIAKLRIGRENLISFPEEDIGDFEDS